MPSDANPWVHIVRGLEEILLGAADLVGRAREDLERRGERAPHPSEARGAEDLGADLRNLWEWGKRYALPTLRVAVRDEVTRWENRALVEPAAARVHEVFRTLLEILDEEPERNQEEEPRSQPAPSERRSAPRPSRRGRTREGRRQR